MDSRWEYRSIWLPRRLWRTDMPAPEQHSTWFPSIPYQSHLEFNVISVDSLLKSSRVICDHATRCHTINVQDHVYEFKVPFGSDKELPVIRFSHMNQSSSTHWLVNAVAQSESIYSKREVEEAKQAQEFSRMLAYSSFKDVSEAISSDALIDCNRSGQ